jgi:hypothetical protein
VEPPQLQAPPGNSSCSLLSVRGSYSHMKRGKPTTETLQLFQCLHSTKVNQKPTKLAPVLPVDDPTVVCKSLWLTFSPCSHTGLKRMCL